MSSDTPKKNKRKKRRSKDPELLYWDATFSEFELWTSFMAGGRKGEPPQLGCNASLTLTGTLDDPLKNNVRKIQLRVSERAAGDMVSTTPGMRDGTEPYHPWMGFLDTRPPGVGATVFLPAAMFETVWAMASTGNVKHAHLTLTKPHYGHAFVTGLALSNQPIE